MLGDFINFESFLNPDKKNWDFDSESIFYNGSEPTVKTSSKAVAFDIETTFDNALSPTVTVSSKAPLTAPCDICHRKVKQLFALERKGLTFFVCCYCYKERYRNCSKVTKSFVDPSKLMINPQPRVKWDDICTTAEQFAPRMNKARKQNRKNKKV